MQISTRDALRLSLLVTISVTVGALTIVVTADQRGRQGNPADDPFVGVTTDGTVVTGLFPIRASGVSTTPVREAAARFLASLSAEQRARTTFAVDSDEWRLWNNVHRYNRAGVSFKELTEAQRERGFDLMKAGLSARGFRQSRDVMRLNGYLADLVSRPEEYGEFVYHLTVMGTPSAS
jgi:hypothetical protein